MSYHASDFSFRRMDIVNGLQAYPRLSKHLSCAAIEVPFPENRRQISRVTKFLMIYAKLNFRNAEAYDG